MKKKLILISFLALTPFARGQLLLEALDAPETIILPNLPNGITISEGQHFIFSAYDTDYLPYKNPTSQAVWTNVPADNINEEKIIDYQGIIPTTGISIQIPITATSVVTLPSFTSSEVTIDPQGEQNVINSTRRVILTWDEQRITSYTKFIKATIKTANNEDLNVKKLDLNGGLGNDYKGKLLASFSLPKSNINTSEIVNYELRVISGIPDKNFDKKVDGENKHQFIYLPIIGSDGKLWLNHNLGADYTNINSPHFNPAKQAESFNDYKAYGSLFKWGTDANGKELINWTSSNTGTYVEDSYDFYANTQYMRDNDPCPIGWITPSYADYDNLIKILNENGEYLDTYWHEGPMKFTTIYAIKRPGYTGYTDFSGPNPNVGSYWTRQDIQKDNRILPWAMSLYRQSGSRKRYEMSSWASKAYIKSIRCVYEGHSNN